MKYRIRLNSPADIFDACSRERVHYEPGEYNVEEIANPVAHPGTNWYVLAGTRTGWSWFSWEINQCYPRPLITILK
jgi:hypothetical protein